MEAFKLTLKILKAVDGFYCEFVLLCLGDLTVLILTGSTNTVTAKLKLNNKLSKVNLT